jgi:hypothetical protein
MAAFFVVVLSGCRFAAVRDESVAMPLWGDLQAGTYRVGYKATWAFDAGRRYGESERRPILVAMWYPTSAESSFPFRYGDYFDLGQDAAVPAMGEFMRELTGRDVAGNFAQLLKTTIRVGRDAPVAGGRFPLLLYHPGAEGSFQEDSVLFEFLASHGYVVLSSAYSSPDPASLGNQATGAATSIQDMRFLIRQAAGLEFVDAGRIGGIGFSIGSQVVMRWMGEADCPLDAAVLLDTTLEYTPEDFPLHRILRDALQDLRPPSVPMLEAASANREPNFGTFREFLEYAPVYQVETQLQAHGDYVANGVLGREFAAAPGEDAGKIRAAYGDLARLVLRFLDQTLKSNASAMERGGAMANVAWRFKAGVPRGE